MPQLSGKESACQCTRRRRRGFDLWVGKFPGEGNGNPLQYSCLENPWCPWGHKESDTTERLHFTSLQAPYRTYGLTAFNPSLSHFLICKMGIIRSHGSELKTKCFTVGAQ